MVYLAADRVLTEEYCMADVHSTEVRSYNMSRITSKNTRPELLVRKYLFSLGLRYRLHNKNMPGKPDLTLAKYKTVVFVNGCFWHGHKGCKHFTMPKSNIEYWKTKIERNIVRDQKNKSSLENAGWNVEIIWECELQPAKIQRTIARLLQRIKKRLL